jgi:prepilin-type N-terminal cleavage/methylation domain-containing protein
MKTNTTKTGFTLIELLVVMAIIGILAALLFPAISSALNSAKRRKAAVICQDIESAILTYMNDYNGRFPMPVADHGSDDNTDDIPSTTFPQQVLAVLMALDAPFNDGHQLNPKRKVYLSTDVSSEDGTFLDPWGTQYQIILDRNLDGSIDYLTDSGEHHRKKAVVVSAGKSKDFSITLDNIANVELPNR